jgi:hypothetical protein
MFITQRGAVARFIQSKRSFQDCRRTHVGKFQMFKQPSGIHLFESRPGYPSLWYILSMPHLFPSTSPDRTVLSCKELSPTNAIALELYVLLSQPQPLWSLLLKVCIQLKMIPFLVLFRNYLGFVNEKLLRRSQTVEALHKRTSERFNRSLRN